MRRVCELLSRKKATTVTLHGDKVRYTIHSGDGPNPFVKLDAEVKRWCHDNLRRPYGVSCYWLGGLGHVVTMWFISEKDATFFKLYWL